MMMRHNVYKLPQQSASLYNLITFIYFFRFFTLNHYASTGLLYNQWIDEYNVSCRRLPDDWRKLDQTSCK